MSPASITRSLNGAQRRLSRRDTTPDELDRLIGQLDGLFHSAVAEQHTAEAVQVAGVLIRAYGLRRGQRAARDDADDLARTMVGVLNQIGSQLWPDDYRPVEVEG